MRSNISFLSVRDTGRRSPPSADRRPLPVSAPPPFVVAVLSFFTSCACPAQTMPVIRANIIITFLILIFTLDLVVDKIDCSFSFRLLLSIFPDTAAHPVSRFQMYPYRAHPFRNVLRDALYRPATQIGGELRPRVGRYVDAASERAAHVRPDFLCRVYLHRAGYEDPRLPVAVVHLQFYRDDASPVFQRGDADAEPFALQPCREPTRGVFRGMTRPRHAHRLQQPELHRLPVVMVWSPCTQAAMVFFPRLPPCRWRCGNHSSVHLRSQR